VDKMSIFKIIELSSIQTNMYNIRLKIEQDLKDYPHECDLLKL
jgi:hypothetical protein